MIIKKLDLEIVKDLQNEVENIYNSSSDLLDLLECPNSHDIEDIEDAIHDLEGFGGLLDNNNITYEFDTLEGLNYDLKNCLMEVEHAVCNYEGDDAKQLIKIFKEYINILQKK